MTASGTIVASSTRRAAHQTTRKIGLLAAWGRYPLVVAGALARGGFEVSCLGVAGLADPALAGTCRRFEWVGLARLGRAVRFFKRHGIDEMTLAGKIHKVVLYQPRLWLKLLPDWTTFRTFSRHFYFGRADLKDDTLLAAMVGAFAADGITVSPATDFAPELLVREGQLTRRGPSRHQSRDIEFGWELARELGRLDIGQCVVVKDRSAIAVEAIEGTDLCVQRAGTLCAKGEFTVVKVAKPNQDMRFDVPTVGLRTLQQMVASGGRVLAIEAGRTILLDQELVIDYANRHDLAIVALKRPPTSNFQPSASNPETPRTSRER